MKKDGWVVEDLGDMTYEETVHRSIALCAPPASLTPCC